MTDLTALTLANALDGMEKKQFSSVEITDAFLGAIEKANPALNAYVVVTADKAKAAAKASDAKRASGKAGPLEERAARHQGFVLHRRRAHHGLLQRARRIHADL